MLTTTHRSSVFHDDIMRSSDFARKFIIADQTMPNVVKDGMNKRLESVGVLPRGTSNLPLH